MVGYLYQVRLALLCSLRRLRADEDFQVSLEFLDDVAFEAHGRPAELLQAKHHLNSTANLTDASPDLWKTIRVWADGLREGSILPQASLYLVTTAAAGAGSAASLLGLESRDEAAALGKLQATAKTSKNKANQSAYAAFLTLGGKSQELLVQSIRILGSSPGVLNLADELKGEVRWLADRDKLDALLAYLEGWWFQRSVQLLTQAVRSWIGGHEIDAQMRDICEQFKRDALPIDEAILTAQVDASAYEEATFVRQLVLLDIGAKRVLAAVREYYRAFEQRSKWLREDLLLIGELERYEQRLIEEWELVFEREKDEIGADAAEEEKIHAAREVYTWVETSVFPLRANVTEPFVTRGSYQILANRLSVGWHPDFMERLRHLLEEMETP